MLELQIVKFTFDFKNNYAKTGSITLHNMRSSGFVELARCEVAKI